MVQVANVPQVGNLNPVDNLNARSALIGQLAKALKPKKKKALETPYYRGLSRGF